MELLREQLYDIYQGDRAHEAAATATVRTVCRLRFHFRLLRQRFIIVGCILNGQFTHRCGQGSCTSGNSPTWTRLCWPLYGPVCRRLRGNAATATAEICCRCLSTAGWTGWVSCAVAAVLSATTAAAAPPTTAAAAVVAWHSSSAAAAATESGSRSGGRGRQFQYQHGQQFDMAALAGFPTGSGHASPALHGTTTAAAANDLAQRFVIEGGNSMKIT